MVLRVSEAPGQTNEAIHRSLYAQCHVMKWEGMVVNETPLWAISPALPMPKSIIAASGYQTIARADRCQYLFQVG